MNKLMMEIIKLFKFLFWYTTLLGKKAKSYNLNRNYWSRKPTQLGFYSWYMTSFPLLFPAQELNGALLPAQELNPAICLSDLLPAHDENPIWFPALFPAQELKFELFQTYKFIKCQIFLKSLHLFALELVSNLTSNEENMKLMNEDEALQLYLLQSILGINNCNMNFPEKLHQVISWWKEYILISRTNYRDAPMGR